MPPMRVLADANRVSDLVQDLPRHGVLDIGDQARRDLAGAGGGQAGDLGALGIESAVANRGRRPGFGAMRRPLCGQTRRSFACARGERAVGIGALRIEGAVAKRQRRPGLRMTALGLGGGAWRGFAGARRTGGALADRRRWPSVGALRPGFVGRGRRGFTSARDGRAEVLRALGNGGAVAPRRRGQAIGGMWIALGGGNPGGRNLRGLDIRGEHAGVLGQGSRRPGHRRRRLRRQTLQRARQIEQGRLEVASRRQAGGQLGLKHHPALSYGLLQLWAGEGRADRRAEGQHIGEGANAAELIDGAATS